MKKPKYKDRYVLGEGYPFQDAYAAVYLLKQPYDDDKYFPREVLMKFPKRIIKPDCPKYRLVLERVK